MRAPDSIREEIERKSAQRRRLLTGQENGVSVTVIDAEILELYAELRVARAQEKHGHRDQIRTNARIERELEKLAS